MQLWEEVTADLVQVQISLRNGAEILVESAHARTDHGVAESEGGRGEDVADGRVGGWAVAGVGPQGGQGPGPQDPGQPGAVGDVLQLGPHNLGAV